MSDNDFDSMSNKTSMDQMKSENKKDGWERDVLEKLAFSTIREQRANRRWGVFFKLLTFSLIFYGIWQIFNLGGAADIRKQGRHTALVEINGTIEVGGSGAADVVVPALDNAFSADSSVGVILRINSPGGSPVQAGMINDEIVRMRKMYPGKHLYVVVDEVCASGGYYIAAAADKIYVNKASIVGSIGVLMDGFGVTSLMEKLGVERRLLTAGSNKGFMDPFSPQSEKDRIYAQSMLDEIHAQFIDAVRAGRGARLKESPEIFSGLFWSGTKAIELGLVDGLGTVDTVARDIIKAENVVDYTEHEGLPDRVLKKFGAAIGAAAIKSAWHGTLPSVR